LDFYEAKGYLCDLISVIGSRLSGSDSNSQRGKWISNPGCCYQIGRM
jgi:hypothetical protein